MPLNVIDVLTARHAGRETVPADSAFRPDRRKRTRTRVHWPLLLLTEGATEQIESVTQNLSSIGFYCLSPTPLTPGQALLSTLKVPAYDPKGEDRTIHLECRAFVIRAEATPDGSFGIACRIENYRLVGNA